MACLTQIVRLRLEERPAATGYTLTAPITNVMSQGEDEGNFICEPMAQALMHQQYDMMAFWRLLALCHTVQPEMVLGNMEYQAQSPDEKALVEAARYAPSVLPVFFAARACVCLRHIVMRS